MNTRLTVLALLVLAFVAYATVPSHAQQFVELPSGTWVNDVTADGSMVVGNLNGEAFYWNWRSDPAPIVIGGKTASAVSDDGTWIAGNIDHPTTGVDVAARWSQATGWQVVGGLSTCGNLSTAYDISGDGDRVVGLMWNGCSARGFLWTFSTGVLELQNLANGNNRASAISGDGSQIGGFAQGSFDRTPAFWDASNTNGSLIDADDVGEIYGFNEDGSVYVGTFYFGGNSYGACVGNTGSPPVDLGSLNTGWSGHAYDISESGELIVGFDTQQLAREPWIWRAGQGMTSITDLLTELGLPATSLQLQTCVATSDDGKVVVGGAYPVVGFQSHGYILEIAPQESPWEDLGGGTSSSGGTPLLSGTGTLVAGEPTSIDLVGAPSGALSLVWTSLTSVPFPVFGGTLYANPFVSEILIPLNGAGEFHAAFPWFTGVPSGLALHFQFIVQDPSIFWGFTLSNGLKATAP